MECWRRVVSLNGQLEGRARRERELWLITFILSAIVALPLIGNMSEMELMPLMSRLVQMIMIACNIVWLLCGGRLTTKFVCANLVLWAMALCVLDLRLWMQRSESIWPCFVVLVDMCLIYRVPTKFSIALVGGVCVWLFLMYAEASYRFGLFDLPGFVTQEIRREIMEERVHCTDLPCAETHRIGYSAVSVGLFVTDFVFTRGFAREVEKEQNAMQGTINTVEEVAMLLSRYDVDAVAAQLDACREQLPTGMLKALLALEGNLRVYRPYLPAALFEEGSTGEVSHPITAHPPPGVATQEATIVFTDIRSSTSIWEAVPEAMRKAIIVHNTTMRAAADRFCGYEVKTIGDAFMVAFETPHLGLAFGLAAQSNLFDADWPAPLFEMPLCAETDFWRGLTVRIGVNSGVVAVEENEITKRTDYFGHTVNVAARLEGVCTPGAVAVMATQWEETDAHAMSAVASDVVEVMLKGVSQAALICSVWPAALAGRAKHPLQAKENPLETPHGSEAASSQGSSQTSALSANLSRMRQHDATVACLLLRTSGATEHTASTSLSSTLDRISPILDRTAGVTVTLVGGTLLVGWNLARKCDAHAETALCFVENVRHLVGSAGVCSGRVCHGGVGTQRQRFVTAYGRCVQRCWALCVRASEGQGDAEGDRGTYLYEAEGDAMIPYALRSRLRHTQVPHEHVYELKDMQTSPESSGDHASIIKSIQSHSFDMLGDHVN